MGLTLQDLKTAMAPLAQIGKGELTFDINGTAISLRALSPEEEIAVQRYAREVVAEGDLTDQANALEYLDRFRVASLGYSIVQVGDLDFRGVEYVETGEKLPNGTPIRLKRHEAVQQLVGTWSRNMTIAAFKKFGELMDQVEKEVDGLIAFEPVDYDAEIARLEERLRELREEQARMKASDNDSRTSLRQQVASAPVKPLTRPGSVTKRALKEIPEDTQTHTAEEAETVTVPLDIDREIVEESEESSEEHLPDEPTPAQEPVREAFVAPMAPGVRKPVFARSEASVPPPVRHEPPVQAPQDLIENPDPLADVESSMVDIDDPQVIEAETKRILEARARAARVAPPHMAAKTVAQELTKSIPAELTKPIPAGTRDGMEVYKMPVQSLTDRRPPEPPPPTPKRSNANPRFKPTRGG